MNMKQVHSNAAVRYQTQRCIYTVLQVTLYFCAVSTAVNNRRIFFVNHTQYIRLAPTFQEQLLRLHPEKSSVGASHPEELGREIHV